MNDNFDDEERINLALNSDFDSALLNCLEDDDDNDDLGGETSDFSHSPAVRPSSPSPRIPRLPSFLLNESGNNVVAGSASSVNGDPLGMAGTSPLPDAPVVTNNNNNGNNNTATNEPASGVDGAVSASGPEYYVNQAPVAPQMHPLAIPSSASCPPVNNTNYNALGGVNPNNNNSNTMNLPAMADPNMTAALQAAFASSFMQLSSNPAFNPALIPLAYNALAAGVDLSNFLPQFQAPPAAAAAAFSITNGGVAAAGSSPSPSSTAVSQQQQQLQQQSVPPVASIMATNLLPQSKAMGKKSGSNTKSGNTKSGTKSSKRSRRSGQNSSNKRSKSSSSNAQSQRQQPPFQIFDAPVELRQNFIQSQRSHGIPVLEDNNSYHFGMTVNGFHPQRSLEEPFMYKSLNAKRPLPDPVPIVDARHADAGSKRLKNAKEQKRAHRISELIDQLRVKMEKGGWKVGIKSKFHTLSSYVKSSGANAGR